VSRVSYFEGDALVMYRYVTSSAMYKTRNRAEANVIVTDKYCFMNRAVFPFLISVSCSCSKMTPSIMIGYDLLYLPINKACRND
jgi:hypothetical protein